MSKKAKDAGEIKVDKNTPSGGPTKGLRRRSDRARKVDSSALADVRGLVGECELSRDLLLEYLHLFQDP